MKLIIGLVVTKVALLTALAQSPSPDSSLKTVRLKPPEYPQIAMAARVTGDVKLRITLHEDGTPETIQVASGPEMLKQTAVESAKGSKFHPEQKGDLGQQYELYYRFIMVFLGCDETPDKSYPHVKYDSNTVTITAQSPSICDPATLRIRSARCLFLWKCGLR